MWLQARLNDAQEDIIIGGTHDIDYQWMQDLRNANPDIKIGEVFSLSMPSIILTLEELQFLELSLSKCSIRNI